MKAHQQEPYVEEGSDRGKQITSVHTLHPIGLVPLKKRLRMTRLRTGSFSAYELVSHETSICVKLECEEWGMNDTGI